MTAIKKLQELETAIAREKMMIDLMRVARETGSKKIMDFAVKFVEEESK